MTIIVKKYIRLATALMAGAVLFTACEKEDQPAKPSNNPTAQAIDPGEGSGGQVLILKGSGLGDMRSIKFETGNVPAAFNSVFNTESALVFRVPDTAFGGNQNIIFTNSLGKELKVPFKVIALPTVAAASAIEFEQGTEITLTGNNLESVSKVTLDGTTDDVTVVSKSRKQLVIRMPATSANRAKLKIVNDSGERLTDIEFVSIDNAFKVFTDEWDAGFANWSWGTTLSTSPENVLAGTKSLKVEYIGAWGGVQMHRNTPLNLAPYKFVTFWVKGADTDHRIQFNFNWARNHALAIPANKWTYFKIAINDMNTNQLEKMIMQVMGNPATFHIDNILLVK